MCLNIGVSIQVYISANLHVHMIIMIGNINKKDFIINITANLEKASTSTLVDVALSIDSLSDSLGLSTALSKDNE